MKRNDLTSDPDCGLDLERGNLTIVCDSSSHYALSFGEISLTLLVVFYLLFRPDFRSNLTSDLIVTLTLGIGFWLVGLGLNGPLRQYFSLYRTVSQREGERGKKG